VTWEELYAMPAMLEARRRRVLLCLDPCCDLSGGYAHVGPCEPCGCGAEHAVAECPARPEAAS
jgi:hypothetical protein